MHHCREAVEGFVERLIAEGVNPDLWQEFHDLEIVFGSADDLDAAVYASLMRRNCEDRYAEYLRAAAACD